MGEANRKINFTVLLTEQERHGKRVESRTDYSAVLVKSKPVMHKVHLALTVLTLGLWGLVWLVLVLTRVRPACGWKSMVKALSREHLSD